MREDVAGCVAGCVVTVGEDAAGCSEALGALSEGLSPNGTSSDRWSSPPGSSSLAPMSTASFSFALLSEFPTDSPLKAAARPSRDSSSTPLKALKVQAPQLQVHSVWALVPALLVPLRALTCRQCLWCPCCILAPFKSVVSVGVLLVLHGVAGTQRLQMSATRKLC